MNEQGGITFVIRAYDQSGFRIAEHTFDAEDLTDLFENEEPVLDFLQNTITERKG